MTKHDDAPTAGPLALGSSDVLGVVAQPLPYWTPVAAGLPALGMPVWLYEPGRGIWVGARADTGDGWLWGNTYGSHYYAETTGGAGAWQCFDNDEGDDYGPTFWMPLPEAPTPNVALSGRTRSA